MIRNLRKQLDEELAVDDYLELHGQAERSLSDDLFELFGRQKERAAKRLRDLGYVDTGLAGQLYGDTAERELMAVLFTHIDRIAIEGAFLGLRSYNRQLKTAKSLSYAADGEVLLELPQNMRDALKANVEQVINPEYVKGVAQTARNVLKDTLQRGVAGALATVQVADEIIEDTAGAFSRARALRIARTEITSGIGMANHLVETTLATDRESASTGRRLVTIGDSDVRDHHVFWHHQEIRFTTGAWEVYNAAGDRIDSGNQFVAGNGERARWPGDPMLTPGNRIGCRCVSTSLVQ